MNPLYAPTDEFAESCVRLAFSAPVTHIYHPLVYAREPHREYLKLCGRGSKRVLFLGMNPGPWGMAQTGVPFGEVSAVRDWLEIRGKIDIPEDVHPSKPVLGWQCPRSEVSGRRLWGMFSRYFSKARDFFSEHIVLNYCPLLFLSAEGRRATNITPDKLHTADKARLFATCDNFLQQVVDIICPEYVVGIGVFAKQRLQLLFRDTDLKVGGILHPSPANPAANRGFEEAATEQLKALGVWQ